MSSLLNVLIIDDSEDDALLLIREIKKDGYKVNWSRADSSETMISLIDTESWDIIITDYEMPKFGGLEALNILNKKKVDIPAIMVSGKMGEETAVEAMIAGANDYIIKGHYARLIPAIKRELKEAEIRKAKNIAEKKVHQQNNELLAANEELQATLEELESTNQAFEAQNQELILSKQELLKSEGRFRSLVETSSDWIWEIDANDIYTYASPKVKELLGYNPEEVIGKVPFDFMPPADSDRLKKIFLEIKEKHSPVFNLENLNVDKNGKSVLIETCAIPIINENGKLTGYRGIDRDITERKKTQEMMIQTEKMMTVGGLAAGMAHEINNPLGIILQGIQNILRRISPENEKNKKIALDYGIDLEKLNEYLDSRDIIEYLKAIKDAGVRAADIIKNMLQFSRRSKAIMELKNINEIIESSIEIASKSFDFNKKYDFRRIDLIKHYDTNLPQIQCISVEIEQVLLNFFTNSTYAMSEILDEEFKPQINIITSKEKDYIVIEVSDNGPGIPETVQKHIFEPFYTTKRPGHGTGLGLSVSYFIIKNNHNGIIFCESEIGKGTKFTIKLPEKNEQ